MFYGASNIQNGLTIDLRHLSLVEVSSDRSLTRVGTGNTWQAVYKKLEPLRLAVVGGRHGGVGVGGLTLGGGISFFSGLHGLACDNVLEFQVVLANGSIVVADTDCHADLYWALKGGGNNFGIVTRMDLATFKQGDMW